MTNTKFSPDIVELVSQWQADAKKHALAALEDDCEVGDDEWCLHRESARIYRKCADQLAAIVPATLSGGAAQTPQTHLLEAAEYLEDFSERQLEKNPKLRSVIDIILNAIRAPAQASRGHWAIEESTPNDGFECYFLLRDGITVGEFSGRQTEQRSRHMQDLVNAANRGSALSSTHYSSLDHNGELCDKNLARREEAGKAGAEPVERTSSELNHSPSGNLVPSRDSERKQYEPALKPGADKSEKGASPRSADELPTNASDLRAIHSRIKKIIVRHMGELMVPEACADDILAALSTLSSTHAAPLTVWPSTGSFLGYRDASGNEMHCRHMTCPHEIDCRKRCICPTAVTLQEDK